MSPTGSARHPAAGFTLLELMVVLAILALAVAIVPANLMKGTGAQSLKADVRMLISGLRYARTKAIASNMPVALVVDPRDMHLSIDGTQQIGALSRTTTFGAMDEQHLLQAGAPATVQFFPDGGSSGGELILSYRQDVYRVSINWLTGAVSTTRE
jgi:general secretion pathway protein H